MEDPGITKVGVAIKADCTRLRKNLSINSQGLFELSHLYKLVKFSESKDTHLINKMLVSLANQVQEHLHLPLFKGEVRGSDWSQKLNLEQIMYAASDPYAAVQLYYTLDAKRKRLEPTPPLPWHAELNRPIRVAEGIEIPTDGDVYEVLPIQPRSPGSLKRFANSVPESDLTYESISSWTMENPGNKHRQFLVERLKALRHSRRREFLTSPKSGSAQIERRPST